MNGTIEGGGEGNSVVRACFDRRHIGEFHEIECEMGHTQCFDVEWSCMISKSANAIFHE